MVNPVLNKLGNEVPFRAFGEFCHNLIHFYVGDFLQNKLAAKEKLPTSSLSFPLNY